MTRPEFEFTSVTQNDVSNEREPSCVSNWLAILRIECQASSLSCEKLQMKV
jgi:hypothetical protein